MVEAQLGSSWALHSARSMSQRLILHQKWTVSPMGNFHAYTSRLAAIGTFPLKRRPFVYSGVFRMYGSSVHLRSGSQISRLKERVGMKRWEPVAVDDGEDHVITLDEAVVHQHAVALWTG